MICHELRSLRFRKTDAAEITGTGATGIPETRGDSDDDKPDASDAERNESSRVRFGGSLRGISTLVPGKE